MRLKSLAILVALLTTLLFPAQSRGYSVLTHEEIVDMLWDQSIKPLILQQYPNLTPEQIKEAHAYAYGGAVIQDLGYYPFGSKQFSDLVHYVRSGDFVRALLLNAQDQNEFAFALGALSHYAADTEGHPAVNRSVSIEFPKLRRKYGDFVTYAQGKSEHLRTEFGFDVVQVAKERYSSQQYHDFIGFEVAQALLERTFPQVYGLQFKDVIKHEELAIGTYRWSIAHLIPKMTQVAVQVKEDDVHERQDRAKQVFLYHLSRADYEKAWGHKYQKPGIGTRVLAAILRFIPKVGPFRALAFKSPTTQTQDLYFHSINDTVTTYGSYLRAAAGGSDIDIPNRDFDTGRLTKPTEYSLADNTYADWLGKLSDDKFSGITPQLRSNILDFFADLNLPLATKKDAKKWQETLAELKQLKQAETNKASRAVADNAEATK